MEDKSGSISGGQHGLGQDEEGPYHDCTGKTCAEESCSMCQNKVQPHSQPESRCGYTPRSRLPGAYTIR
eukprot:6844414-Prorocentrum_lima.AAC.1